LEEILAQAKRVAEEAEVFSVTSEETTAQFEANRLKNIQSKQSTSVALRIVKAGQIGYATATRWEDSPKMVDMAVETAQFGTTARFNFPPLTDYPNVAVFDTGVIKSTPEEMAELGEAMIATVREQTPDLVCEAAISKSVVSVRLINSGGGQADYKQSGFSLGVEGQLIHDTDMLFVGESQSSCRPISDHNIVTQAVLKQLEMAKNQASAPTRSLPVIFTPHGVASALLLPLMTAFNGKTVLEGASPLGNRLGQQVFDEKLSLRDDPTIAYRPGSRPCDDEGIPSQCTPLIENGTVANFLYDLQTAALAGTRSTGNGRRSRGGLPSPSPSAFVISPGSVTFQEMVNDIKEGLVVEQLMGAEQGNILGGDFSGNVLLGYKIENGKIAGRVKDTMVSGNIYSLLKATAAIGSDTKWVGGFLNSPSIYIPGVSVATK